MRKPLLAAALATAALAGPARATSDKALVYDGAGQGKVVFDGRLHASKGLVCKDCHVDLFGTRKKALISVDDHVAGKACFACHDGHAAPGACVDCHRDPSLDRARSVSRMLRLKGAASVVDSLVKPARAAVEKATGVSLVIDKSNAGKGLVDLIEGRCEAAMASASLEATLEAARQAGLTRAVPDLRMHVIGTSEVVFVVHPSNPVKALSWEQLRDIHTGKIASWKAFGGRDEPIHVYTDAAASATRGLVKQVVLANAEYASSAKAVDFVKKVNEEVARDPAGVGALGKEFADPAMVRIVETRKVERPLALVTVGEPSPMLRQVVEAYRAEAQKQP